MSEPILPTASADPSVSDADADTDLTCPVCDYSLRGLPEPRCPECGYAFDWAELREKNRQRQAWFYEHSGTFKSHLKTRWRSLRPWSFWKTVHAYTLADEGRLWQYRGVTLALLLVVAGMTAAFQGASQGVSQWLMRRLPAGGFVTSTTPPRTVPYVMYPARRFVRTGTVSVPPAVVVVRTLPSPPLPPTSQPVRYYVYPSAWAQWVEHWLRTTSSRSYYFGRSSLVYQIVMPFVLTPGLLMLLPGYWLVLRGSVLRAQIRPVHLARVGAYSADALPWLLLVGLVAQVAWTAVSPLPLAWTRGVPHALSAALVVAAVVVGGLTLRLASALRRYLRFPHAGAVAIGFGVIAGLVWTVLVLQTVPMF